MPLRLDQEISELEEFINDNHIVDMKGRIGLTRAAYETILAKLHIIQAMAIEQKFNYDIHDDGSS